MRKEELIPLLEEIAEKGLAEGAEIDDHPCSVAVRAIDQCFDDIEFLREVARFPEKSKSKRAQTLLGLRYNPEW